MKTKFEETLITNIRHIDIEQLAEALAMHPLRGKALCPFHDDSRPSLSFSRKTNRFRCWACGATGDVIDLTMQVLHLDFPSAVRWVAQTFAIDIPEDRACHRPIPQVQPRKLRPIPPRQKEAKPDLDYLKQLIARPRLTESARRFLFEERKLDPEIIKMLQISSIDTPMPMSADGKAGTFHADSLLIPYFSPDFQLKTVQARKLNWQKDSLLPRFQFPKGSTCSMFNQQILGTLQPREHLYLAEGVSDTLALLSAGHKAVGIPSATMLKKDDIEMLQYLVMRLETQLHVFPDCDAPGEKLFADLQRHFPEIQRHALPFGCKDFSDYWKTISPF